MTAFTVNQQIDEAYIPTEQDWEDLFSEQEHKFLFIGMRKGFATVLAYLAPTGAEALATCQRLNPDFEIHRWDLADHLV